MEKKKEKGTYSPAANDMHFVRDMRFARDIALHLRNLYCRGEVQRGRSKGRDTAEVLPPHFVGRGLAPAENAQAIDPTYRVITSPRI